MVVPQAVRDGVHLLGLSSGCTPITGGRHHGQHDLHHISEDGREGSGEGVASRDDVRQSQHAAASAMLRVYRKSFMVAGCPWVPGRRESEAPASCLKSPEHLPQKPVSLGNRSAQLLSPIGSTWGPPWATSRAPAPPGGRTIIAHRPATAGHLASPSVSTCSQA
jgi:hypothetical protein